MNKILSILSLCFLMVFKSNAQDLPQAKAQQLLQGNASVLNIKLEGNDIAKVTNAYTDERLGLTYIYIQQNYKNIKVFNTIKTTVFKNDVLQSQAGDFVASIATKTNSEVPTITAVNALKLAVAHLGLPNVQNLTEVENTLTSNNQIKFSPAGIAKKNIVAELVWRSIDDDKTLQLCWNISIDVLNAADYWNVRVDAATGNIIDKDNYTVYEKNIAPSSVKSTLKSVSKKNIKKESFAKNKSYKHVLTSGTNTASYRVIAYPKENKNAGITIETDPWLKAGVGNNATTYGWHYDGLNDFTKTRGNNVFAYDDSLKQDAPGRSPNSSTALPALTFNFVPNFTKQPTVTVNREFATTNLFYWNNIMHDIAYQYGFTEVAGNFQVSNLGRGGAEDDCVNAEAQDGSGSNNANFSTPADGTNGRMQMFLWTTATPKLDGDIDNGVVAHEFGHGISNRLTGGPTNSSCLNNYEQGGEGWSDYIALMVTTDWSTALLTDGTKKRPMGVYLYNPSGNGIRTFPYSTDMGINPHTYIDVADTLNNPRTTNTGAHIPNATEVHYIGEVWCSAIWDMTWNIIQQVGYISPNLFDANATGGNNISLNLVMQGLKLQKCSPGFLDSRNAILKADSILYNGKYRCAIWTAFAGRGMGLNATQGTSTKTTDQVENFDLAPILSATSFSGFTSSVQAGQGGVVYTCPAVAGARSYQWTYSGTGATINGTGNLITIDFATNATAGTLTVLVVNQTGCTGSPLSAAITVTTVPVVLSNFTVEKNNNTAAVNWTTKTEINSKHFEVQRSIDGIHFTTIGTVEAKGNSTNENNYSFTDAKPFVGVNYYRLKQVDINGKYEFSAIKAVKFNNDGKFVVNIYPNPVKDVLNVLATNGEMKEIRILNTMGKEVYKTTTNTNGTHQIQLNKLSAGTYFIEVASANSTIVEKFIKN